MLVKNLPADHVGVGVPARARDPRTDPELMKILGQVDGQQENVVFHAWHVVFQQVGVEEGQHHEGVRDGQCADVVTGGGGSIGSELCRQMCAVVPRRIVIFDMYENDAYLLKNEILRRYDDIECVVEVGSVCDKERLRAVFTRHRPDVVFHAAAHKHVPLMELCPREAIQNNVFGTLNTVLLADEFEVDRFIFISTDKAVNPTSVMGATKRMGEMVIQHYAQE